MADDKPKTNEAPKAPKTIYDSWTKKDAAKAFKGHSSIRHVVGSLNVATPDNEVADHVMGKIKAPKGKTIHPNVIEAVRNEAIKQHQKNRNLHDYVMSGFNRKFAKSEEIISKLEELGKALGVSKIKPVNVAPKMSTPKMAAPASAKIGVKTPVGPKAASKQPKAGVTPMKTAKPPISAPKASPNQLKMTDSDRLDLAKSGLIGIVMDLLRSGKNDDAKQMIVKGLKFLSKIE